MTLPSRPLVISAPEPRTLDLIFTPESKARLFAGYDVHETTARAIAALPDATLAACRYLVGQPALSAGVLARMTSLRCIFNVEGNLLNNMP
ncbi:hypothetical protein AB0T83_16220 [Fluviibacterium sp. DFM31]|uniref:Uncharacterized protein n=1 Tax=Meridianimarinicoccus marinus TaxID=3231483 RepID=A0ABV3L9Z3_9RHOB